MIPVPNMNTRQTVIPFPMPAPTGGLNGRDPLAAMPPGDAYLMDNIVPGSATCVSRTGCEQATSTTLGAPVQTLDVYAGSDGDVMLAWAGTSIFNVSTDTPAVLATGMNSALPINAMFSNASDNAQHLISVTGFDVPKHFDGATMTDLVMTGVNGTPSQLNFVFTFKGRLYFGQRENLGFYYLPVGQIQGALEYYDLGQVSRNGGSLIAIASYSEGGETPQDYIVFITSKGECIVFSGSDPSDANAWGLVGRYFAATPIGSRCVIYYNNELTILTLAGALPFSLIRDRGVRDGSGVDTGADYALTSKLGKLFTDFTINRDVPGWSGTTYPGAGWLIINVPLTASIAGGFIHYVMNTTTRAWCRFTGWNGLTFVVFNRRLYYGTYDGRVMLADEGLTDDGEPIRIDVKQAYSGFSDDRGAGPLYKHFQWASLIVACEGTPALTGKFSVNFKEETPQYSAALTGPSGAEWDVEQWDLAQWGSSGQIQQVNITLNRHGYAGSLWLRVVLPGLRFEWYATQYAFIKTNGMLL